MKISVLIVTFLPFETLARNIKSLRAQDFPEDDYEVIISCHGLLDITKDKLPFKHKKVIYTESDGYHRYCKVANNGLKVCSGDLIFLMHTSTELMGINYLNRLWEESEMGNCVVQTLKKTIHYDKDGYRDEFREYMNSEFLNKQDAIPRRYLEEVGGMSEEYDGDQGFMDWDLVMKLRSMTDCKFKQCGEIRSITHNVKSQYPQLKTHAESGVYGSRNVALYNMKWSNKKILLS